MGPGLGVGKVQRHKGSSPQKGCQLTRAGVLAHEDWARLCSNSILTSSG